MDATKALIARWFDLSGQLHICETEQQLATTKLALATASRQLAKEALRRGLSTAPYRELAGNIHGCTKATIDAAWGLTSDLRDLIEMGEPPTALKVSNNTKTEATNTAAPPDGWPGPKSPQQWRKQFGADGISMSPTTFTRLRKEGMIRSWEETSKRVWIHPDDVKKYTPTA